MTDFAKTKSMFHLPEGIIYLDGNSLGPLPLAVQAKMANTITNEWGQMLIKGWNDAGWMQKPGQIGDRLANMLGAAPSSIVLGDTLSIKTYQALACALDIAQNRKIILSDRGNFPTDLYMAQGLIDTIDRGHNLLLVEPEDILTSLSEEIGVLLLTQIDYGTGRMHDMAKITAKAHQFGIITVWDLAHSAGAIPIDLEATQADFATGCTYKYLNSGPGGPAFIYVAPKHQTNLKPALAGWHGHEAPFAFELDYRRAPTIECMRVGTPPILQFAALEAALDVWNDVDINHVRAKSIELSQLFIQLVEDFCPQFELVSPREPSMRGSQVTFGFDEGYAMMQAIIEHGVIADFRAPDKMRFGITPLFIDENDIHIAAQIIADVANSRIWKEQKYHQRKPVT